MAILVKELGELLQECLSCLGSFQSGGQTLCVCVLEQAQQCGVSSSLCCEILKGLIRLRCFRSDA
jgi:hypothetical protein